jgi:hypothetical protein
VSAATLTERDIIAKAGALNALVRAGQRVIKPVEYLTEGSISKDRTIEVSPVWLGRVKKRLRSFRELAVNWDSYGGLPLDPRIEQMSEELIEWFALGEMPPPDIFATSDGGVQIEWHIRRTNIEINLSPLEGTAMFFQDLITGEEWSGPGSESTLQAVRRRLITRS